MTTKSEGLFSKEKPQSFANDNSQITDNQNFNLNLNQSHKCPILNPVHSCSKLNNDKNYDSTVSDNYEEKEKLQSWNKSFDLSFNSLKFAYENETEAEKPWKIDGPSNATKNNSTLSLHITAYENFVEAENDKNNEDLKSELIKNGKNAKQIFTNSAFIFQSPFEFPRQQENHEASEPEMSKYKSSQRLSNPNETSSQQAFKGKKVSDYFVKPEKAELTKTNRKRASIGLQAEYARLIVGGITIQLPPGLKPYPSQQIMMVKLIQSLKGKKHAMIESPTGSGKSLGLLSACCAWLQDYKAKRRIAKQNCPKHGTGSIAAGFNKAASDAKIPRFDETGPSKTGKENNESSFLNHLKNEVDDSLLDNSDYNAFGEVINESIFDNSEHQPDPECTCSDMKKIRIYYGTRTHKQISQVIKEYGRLPYGHEANEKQLRHTILASREQSCLNQDVRKDGASAADITAACRDLLAPDGLGCRYRHNLRNFDDPNKLRKKISNLGGGVWDIEDLSEVLREPEICAYFASTRSMTSDADIIFTPFNYLLDPIIRNSSDVILKNSIVILDEAHNVEDTCRSAVSFQFKESEFGAAFNSFNEKISAINDHSMLKMMKENGKESETLNEIEKYKESLNRLFNLAKRIFAFFGELAKLLSESQVNRESKTWNWEAFLELLKNKDSEKNLYYERDGVSYKQYMNDFQTIATPKQKDESGGGNDKTTDLLNEFKISPVAIVLVEKYLYFMTYFSVDRNMENYKCNITLTPPAPVQTYGTQRFSQFRKPRPRFGAAHYNEEGYIDGVQPSVQPIRPGFDATMNFWCMSPSVAFTEAFKECHSVVLASGTLCPTETLKSELGLKFELEMEGQQVIPPEQIFASVISRGPSGYPFKCTYKNMQDQTFYIQLLKTIRDVCQRVPKGVLVFVSSYRILNDLQKFMNFENLRTDIEKIKRIFFEPNRSSDLKRVLEDYTFAIENGSSDINSLNGAIMFAVFRGKVSEGIDFTDDMARCVICIGIPFPNATDELVLQKKAFNDLHSRSTKMLSGDEWYSTQAYRALNQALGRCLRHRNDWGAILLVDERFIEKANPKCPDSKKISRWVRHRLVQFNDHQNLLNALSHFVDERLKDEKLKPVKKEIVFDIDDESTTSSPSASSSTSSSTANRKTINSTSTFNRRNSTLTSTSKRGKTAPTGSKSAFGI